MASGFIEESSYETQTCPDCGRDIDWEDNLGESVDYDIDELVRVDIASSVDVATRRLDDNLDLRYDSHHGRHGKITDKSRLHSTEETEYTVGVLDQNGNIEDKIKTTEKNLRTPYYTHEKFE
jgi:hypothetical protein